MISVCIATYNGEKYIREQIDSILVQLEEKDELKKKLIIWVIQRKIWLLLLKQLKC